MKSNKIKVLNNNVHAGDGAYVKVSDFNKVIEDLEFLYPVYNARFEGAIYLDKMMRQYAQYSVDATLDVKLGNNPAIGGGAFIRFIGDGATTPTFTAFTKMSTSEAYDATLAAVNLVTFGYDGTVAWYCITLVG